MVATDDDVVEVLSGEEPLWEPADPGRPNDPVPGKSQHLYLGEDAADTERLRLAIQQRNRRH